MLRDKIKMLTTSRFLVSLFSELLSKEVVMDLSEVLMMCRKWVLYWCLKLFQNCMTSLTHHLKRVCLPLLWHNPIFKKMEVITRQDFFSLICILQNATTKCHKLLKLHHRHTIALNDNILSTIVLNLVPLEGFQIWLIFAFSW